MICPTAQPPGHIPPLKSVDECGRKWSALCLSAYRAIHRMPVPESLGWRDSSVHIERPMETDGGQGHLDKPLSYRLWKHVRYFSACHRLWYKLPLTQRDAVLSVREINGLHATGMEHWLPMPVGDINWILLAISPRKTLVRNESTGQSAQSLCNSVTFLTDF